MHISIEFIPPDKRRRDDDNLIAAFKSGRDGLADALNMDDNLFRIHPFISSQTQKKGLVRVTLLGDNYRG